MYILLGRRYYIDNIARIILIWLDHCVKANVSKT